MANKQYLKIFKTESDYYSQYGELGDPHVVLIEDSENSRNVIFYDSLKESKDYFTIVALDEDITVKLTHNNLQYYNNSSNNWETVVANESVNISAGEKMKIKISNPSQVSTGGIGKFVVDKPFKVEGNIMSLLYGESFIGKKELKESYSFKDLFADCTTLQSASALVLPARIITPHCYHSMFYNCSSLKDAPQLPAIQLANCCYQNMFERCSSLKNTPRLPATTLAEDCYFEMFNGCSSLTTTPELPATTLAKGCYCAMFSYCNSLSVINKLPATTLEINCYNGMFSECHSLKNAPELPATTLAKQCYYQMFNRCYSLTTAPALPATTLDYMCYEFMFKECTSLKTAPALPATTLAEHCYNQMFLGCTSLKTAPALPATTLKNSCYWKMFMGCKSLTETPTLPAKTLTNYCYESMFDGCSSLITVNTISGTKMALDCYKYMFSGCTSLTSSPALPATTLAGGCYSGMFYGCSGLNKSPILPATELKEYCYESMFKNCTNLKEITIYAKTFENGCLSGWVDGIIECTIIKNVCTLKSNFPNGSIPSTFTVKEYCKNTPSIINPFGAGSNVLFKYTISDSYYVNYTPTEKNDKFSNLTNLKNCFPNVNLDINVIYAPSNSIGENVATRMWYKGETLSTFLDKVPKITYNISSLVFVISGILGIPEIDTSHTGIIPNPDYDLLP